MRIDLAIARCLLMLCCVTCFLGCEYIARRQRDSAIKAAQTQLPALVSTLSLVPPLTKERDELKPAIEVVVTDRGIWVDNSALVAQWWRGALGQVPELLEDRPVEAWLRPLQLVVTLERGVVPKEALGDGASRYLVTPLHDLLSELFEQQKRYGYYATGSQFQGRINLYLGADLPFETVGLP
jgi:hypothetical protein